VLIARELRRRNVYDKKPQRYANDNRTVHLTARSDKSVAYVTNNKRLCSTFCSVEANYWQTRSIARPLCDSRASCFSFPSTKPLCELRRGRPGVVVGYINFAIFDQYLADWLCIENDRVIVINLSLSSRAFRISAPSNWISLSQNVRECSSLGSFWNHLKTQFQFCLLRPLTPNPHTPRFCGLRRFINNSLSYLKWNGNTRRKSCAVYRTVTLPMTLSGL